MSVQCFTLPFCCTVSPCLQGLHSNGSLQFVLISDSSDDDEGCEQSRRGMVCRSIAHYSSDENRSSNGARESGGSVQQRSASRENSQGGTPICWLAHTRRRSNSKVNCGSQRRESQDNERVDSKDVAKLEMMMTYHPETSEKGIISTISQRSFIYSNNLDGSTILYMSTIEPHHAIFTDDVTPRWVSA